MHKNIGAAAIGHDETKSAICIEEFDPPSWHAINPIQRTVSAPIRRARRAGAWHNALLQAGPAPERAVMPIRVLLKRPVPLTRSPRRRGRAPTKEFRSRAP